MSTKELCRIVRRDEALRLEGDKLSLSNHGTLRVEHPSDRTS
jgi:hypothetical protein